MLGYMFFEFLHLYYVYYDTYTLLNTTLQHSYGIPLTKSTLVVKSNKKIVKMYVESHINVFYFIIYYVFKFVLWGWSKVQGLLKFYFWKKFPMIGTNDHCRYVKCKYLNLQNFERLQILLNYLHVLHFNDNISDDWHSLSYTRKVHKHMLLRYVHAKWWSVCIHSRTWYN